MYCNFINCYHLINSAEFTVVPFLVDGVQFLLHWRCTHVERTRQKSSDTLAFAAFSLFLLLIADYPPLPGFPTRAKDDRSMLAPNYAAAPLELLGFPTSPIGVLVSLRLN